MAIGQSGGGGGALAGISDALSGIGKFMEKNPGGASSILGAFGQAISPQNTWQSRLGGAAAGVGSNMAQRDFLQQLLSGQPIDLGTEEEESGLNTPASFYDIENPLRKGSIV